MLVRKSTATGAAIILASLSALAVTPPALAATDPPALTGRLLTTISTPATSGTVQVLAWPANDQLSRLDVGEDFDLTPVATAPVGADGRFTIPDTTRTLAGLDGGQGYANVVVTASTTEAAYAQATTLPANPSSATSLSTTSGPDAGTVDLGDLAPLAAGAETITSRADAVQPMAVNGFCSGRKYANSKPRWAAVGGTFTHRAGAVSTYRFARSATARLEVGISSSGKYGTFRAGGNTTVTNGVSYTFPANTSGARYHRVRVDTGLFKITCVTPDGIPYNSWREYRATGLPGGSSNLKGSTFGTVKKYCQSLPKNTTWEKTSTRAREWGGGFKSEAAIGINLDSQSGFTTDSKITIVSKKGKARLCGMNDAPGYSPGRIKVIK